MNPSAYRIPQLCPPDRRVARQATLAAAREDFAFASDDLAGDPAPGFQVPPYLAKLPASERFSAQKFGDLMAHKVQGQVNGLIAPKGIRRVSDYARMFKLLPVPSTSQRWQDDAEFARQRVAGVNPMHLRARDGFPRPALADAASRVLKRYDTTLSAVVDQGRLFETDYSALADPRIQKHAAQRGRFLAAPLCLFFVGADGALRPLAIQLWPDGHAGENPVYTPLDDKWAWTLAKWHAQCADGTMHEGVYHLLETHLVTETVAVCARRQLHPDHPIAQLVGPHFAFNLAIDSLARTDMLGPGKAIDLALSAGSAGALNAMRLVFNSGWSWADRALAADLAARGVDDPARLPSYPYRDDARRLHTIVAEYVTAVVLPFYRSDAQVAGDTELQGFVAECASHLPGFPAARTRAELAWVATEIVFRASVQHAAVNNGQYDAYGWVPNSPGAMFAAPPTKAAYTEQEAVAALPRGSGAFAQLAMAWVLSEPTHYGLLGTGDAPAFAADLHPEARGAVATLRRRLTGMSREVEARNATAAVPYTYLDPRNVECSTGT